MKLIRYCVPLLLVFTLIATISPSATAQSKNLPDSLRSVGAALAEGSLQHLLDSLGYSINVSTDELGIETFCAPGGLNTATMVLEVAGSAVSAKSGYYNAANHFQRYQLFGPTAVPGTSVTFTVASGINDIGFYMQPNLDGSSVYWYSETVLNSDHFDHVWVFSTGVPREYILAFEDMASGGDADYQDLVIKVIFDYDVPSLNGCPANVTVQCDNIPAPANVTATADCDPNPTVTMQETTTPGSCPDAYTITRTWTATDQWGSTASCSQTITVIDNVAPVLAGCPADVTVQCDAIPAAATVTATDNCDASVDVTMTETTTPGSCPQAYTLTRTWTATDDCGNNASRSQIITVIDNIAPVLAGCPADVTVQCDAIPAAATVTATDNCDASVDVTMTETTTPGSCPQAYTLTRTWTATDDCGNSASCSQVITVIDDTAPVLAGCPADVTVQCDAVPAAATVTATDNCDASVDVTMTETTTPGSCPQAYTLTRTWTATDDCGNNASCSQVITVIDDTAPVLAGCPADVTVECDAIPVAATVTATDNCDASVSVTMTETTTPGSCPQAYTLTRTWTATDDCGNSASCSQVITVTDTQAPLLTCPGPVTVQHMVDVPAPNPASVTVSDNCDPSPVVTFVSDIPSGGSCPLTITRTYKATDACGNEATCTQTITVDDDTPPVLAGCPADVTVQCDAIPAAATVTANDECDGPVAVTLNETTTPGSCPNSYTLTRTWTATDGSGNDASCSQVITVIDDQAPLVTCPGPVTVQCMTDVPAPNPASVMASDNCDPSPVVTFVSDVQSGGTCPLTITRTYKATDACGNEATCTQTITVDDTTPPVLAGCPTDITVEYGSVPAAATVTATDNCDPSVSVTLNETTTPGASPHEYTVTRTWTATDACGNTTSCTQVITVVDTTPPVLTGCPPSDITVECDAVPAPAAPSAIDVGGGSATVTFDETTTLGSCPQAYTLVRTWTATDGAGNSVTCNQIITVVDTTPPTMTCPGAITVQCMTDVPAPNPASVAVSDNCDPSPVVTFVSDVQSGGTCPLTITRTYKAADACGNEVTCTQTITVNDNTPPVLAGCPANVTVQCDAIPVAANVTATDNCDPNPSVAMVETTTPGSCASNYTLTRTWTATDNCGNNATCTQVITVVDTTPPVLAGCPADMTVACGAVPAAANVTATDNCDTDPSVTMDETTTPGSCPQAYTLTRTWTATDACGNSASCSQVITVTDGEAPVVTCPGPVTVQCMGDVPTPNPGAVMVSDNCDPSPVVTFVSDVQSGGTCPLTITRTYKATDACGNEATCTQTITVNDDTPPVLAGCPADVAIECDATIPPAATVTATDNCDSNPSVTMTETTTPGSCPQAYTLTRTWTATDDCGNTTSCSQNITVSDNMPPVVTRPADVTVDFIGDVPAPDPGAVTATDNCDASPTLSHVSDVYDGHTCPGTITRTYRATDACGNHADCEQLITVRYIDDQTPPVLSECPSDVTIACDATIPTAPTITATDECDPDVPVDFAETTTPGACANSYTITRTWSATDDSGNNTTCTQVITVVDNEAPVLAGCPSDVTVSCDAVPGAATVTATDNCDATVTVTYNETTSPGSCPNNYTIHRTWSAVDECANQTSCTQVITVVDNDPPVLTGCPADLEIACDSALPAPATVVANDNCAGVTLDYVQTQAAGSCPQETIYTRTWTATDACGNQNSCSQTITARDTRSPECTMPADTSYIFCSPTQICRPLTATDNCDAAPVWTVVSGPGTITGDQWCYGPSTSGSWAVTVRCTDGCGNSCEGTFNVSATVNQAPSITNCPSAPASVHWGQTFTYDLDATDPDAGQNITFSLCNGAPQGLAINATTGVINWPTHSIDVCDGDVCVIVTDPCGLADTCGFHVNVLNDPPVIGCVDDQSICYGYPFATQVTATDPDHGPYGPWFFLLSGPTGLTVDHNTGAIDWPEPTPGSHEVCVLATDSARACEYSPNNSDTCCFTLNVVALDVVIESVPTQIQGQFTNVGINFKYEDVNWPVGGYDFLIQYDPSALCFTKATAGEFLGDCAWEYFTYRFGPNGNCGVSACPSGILRVTAMAESTGGNIADHPDCYTNDGVPSPGPGSSTSTELAQLTFLVSNDRTYECQFAPIKFIWYDCGDNSLSNVYGDTLHISNHVYEFGGFPADDNWIEITGNDNEMPTVTGAPSPECNISFKHELIRCANFYDGGVNIACAEDIDAAGDINLNGIAYEVADAVMFTNYFVNGPEAFDPHYDGSAAASDCNRDGLALTVADLVYEIRVIIGDALPYTKSAPVTGRYSFENGVVAVDDGLNVGAAVLTVAGAVTPELMADGMDMVYRFDGRNTRIVVTPPLDRSTVQSFTGEFLRNVTGEILSFEMATADGVAVVAKNVPTTYTLKQNFPNPFNPATTIEFALPKAGQYELTIYNIQGQVVDSYRGTVETPGTVHYEWNAGDRASGIYLYRLTTDDFTATRKMLLLK